MENIETLATPVMLQCGLILPNRIVKGPMAESLAKSSTANRPNDLHNVVYRAWGEANYGLIVTGNVQVDPRYLGDANDLVFHNTDLNNPVALSDWKIWATACQSSGTPAVVQMCHTGRQSVLGRGDRSLMAKALAPSAIALDFPGGWFTKVLQRLLFGTPKEMTLVDIDEVVDMFVNCAKMAFIAGFKGVELHAAHGYLFTQFLSPKMNTRTDDYGGTPENRLKFTLRVIAEIRAATSKSFCIGVKLNSSDFQSMGISEAEVLAQVTALSSANVDFIDISGGTYENAKTMPAFGGIPLEPIVQPRESTIRREAYFTEFAAKARKAAPGTVIMVTGGFRTRVGMASAVQQGACDLIGIARPAALEPRFPIEKILNPKVSDEEAVAVNTKVEGGWLKNIPIIGLGAESIWHAAQIGRIAVGKKPDPALHL